MTGKAGANSNCLKDALAAFRATAGDDLDLKAAAVLDRLAGDERAAAAFAELDLNGGGAAEILATCIQADELRRTFKDHIELRTTMLGESRKDGRLVRLGKAVAELRRFVGELDRPPDDRLSASLRYDDPTIITEMKRGLYYIDDAIKARRTIARETTRRLGATRKSVDAGKAAETAAIGWLAEGVRRCCGRPFHKAAADLAEVILGCEVTIDRIRQAYRTRRRDWRER